MQSILCLICMLAVLVGTPPFSYRPSRPGELTDALPEKKAFFETLQADERITVDESAWIENHENERRGPLRAPIMVLRQGQRYQVTINFEGSNRYAVFNKSVVSASQPQGNWRFHHFQDWSYQNRGKGELKAADFGPSRKCLVSFWALDEGKGQQGSSLLVYFTKWTRSSRSEHGRNLVVFTFEFQREGLTATVELSRLS